MAGQKQQFFTPEVYADILEYVDDTDQTIPTMDESMLAWWLRRRLEWLEMVG